MKHSFAIVCALMLLTLTPACAADNPSSPKSAPSAQTGTTAAVPAAFSRAASKQGTVERLDYASTDTLRGGSVTKTAYVYLPHGYEADGSARYNIIYLMHGWGGSAGEYFTINGGAIKNMLDNMIERGEIPPVIAVSPSFYNAASAGDFSSSVSELREFHKDFENHLMPAVEGKYRTYAASTAPADLAASRDHRAFGGFSLGSVTTWMQFCYDSDYIRYFLPMSGSCWYYGGYGDFQFKRNVDFIENLVKTANLDERGYFIYHAVGTSDNVKYQSEEMAREMLSRGTFTSEHYVFYQKTGGHHDFAAVQEFMYNALPLFFKTN